MGIAAITLAILLFATLLFFFSHYHAPLLQLKKRLAAINSGEADPAVSRPPAGIVGDITAQIGNLIERSELVAKRAEDEGFNLQAILGSMREGVVLLDQQKRVRLANDKIYQLLPTGLSPINRTLLELFRNHLLHRTIETSFVTPEPQTVEFFVDVLENGQLVTKTFEVTCIAVTGYNGMTVGALAVFHDLTRVKALENIRKDFVANVSHELRTPLSIISGYVETMLDDNLEDVVAGRKFLKVMRKHAERLHLLVEDLLTISQLESQRTILDFSLADLSDCAHRIVEQLEPAFTAKKLRAKFNFPGNFPLIEIDAHRMDQVFFNLLDNAVKHGRQGDEPIEIRGAVLDGNVQISVRDHGPGIPQKDQPHLFERFYRVDEARSREVGGTGLGLSIVKHVVQAHGGWVEVHSRVGEGATFMVTLPFRQSRDGEVKKD